MAIGRKTLTGIVITIIRWSEDVDGAFIFPYREQMALLDISQKVLRRSSNMHRSLHVMHGRQRRGLDAIIEVDTKMDPKSDTKSKLRAFKKRRKLSAKEGFMNTTTQRKREAPIKRKDGSQEGGNNENHSVENISQEKKEKPDESRPELKTYSGNLI